MEPNYKELYLAEQEKVKKYKQKCVLFQKLILDAHDDGHLDTCDLCLSYIVSTGNMCRRCQAMLCDGCEGETVNCGGCQILICSSCQIEPEIHTCVKCWNESKCENNFHTKKKWLEQNYSKMGHRLHNIVWTTLLCFNTVNPKPCRNIRSVILYWLFIDITQYSQLTDKLCQYRNGCRNPIFGLTGEIYCQGCQQKDKNRTFLIGDISD